MRQLPKRILNMIKEEIQELLKKPLSLIVLILDIISGFGIFISSDLGKMDIHWLILPVAILISIVLWKYIRLKIEISNFKETFTINESLLSAFTYIMNAKKRTAFNDFDVRNVDIEYEFRHDNGPANAFMQTFTWNFLVQNNSQKPINRMGMMVAKTVFSKHSNIEFYAIDNQTKRKMHIVKGKKYANQQYIEIIFDGNGLAASESLEFKVIMQWEKAYQMLGPETIIVGPLNYSCKTHHITTTIKTNSAFLEDARVTYVAVKRGSLTESDEEYNTSILRAGQYEYNCQHNFKPDMDKLYLIRIVSESNNEQNPYEERTLVGSAT